MELIEVETIRTAPVRRGRRRALALGAFVVVGGGAAVAWLLPTDGDDRDAPPAPTVLTFEGDVSLEQAVALAWADWQAQVATSECLAAHDFTWTPTIQGEAWVAPAAQRLAVEPRYVEIPPREATQNPITLELDSLRIEESDAWYAAVEDGGCVVTPTLINIADAGGVESSLTAASRDEGFLEALAAAAWRQEHPEAWLAHWVEAYFAIDRQPLEDVDAAQRALDDAVAIAADETAWVPIGTQVTDLAVTAYGVDGAGHVVVISVETQGAAHPVTWAFGGSLRNQPRCDDVQLLLATPSLAAGGFARDPLSDAIWDALVAEWCGGPDARPVWG